MTPVAAPGGLVDGLGGPLPLIVAPARRPPRPRPPGLGDHGPELLPLDAGEQYRFTFAMDSCIGCHSCEVACAEQNDTPVTAAWRRVGELEAGTFPTTRRLNLSMACNHCLEPACLTGCPTGAYTKLANGVVKHHAEECVGCQYCMWNCPYEVPVFDKARKVVAKCDMCLPRLEAGQLPACVLACPTHAIGVEAVDVAAWRADPSGADGAGMPPAALTLSTTRLVGPAGLPADLRAASDHRVEPAEPHWPLIALTLLTQVAVFALVATLGVDLAGWPRPGLAAAASVAFAAGAAGLLASLLHLGRPGRAYKALRNLRRSWLSREVALFSAFSALSGAYAALLSAAPGSVSLARWAGGLAAAAGLAGLYASGRLYLVKARPVWDSWRTLVAFFATGASVGPLVALLSLSRNPGRGGVALLLAVSAAGILAQCGAQAHLVTTVRRRPDRQHQGTALLLLGRFRALWLARLGAAGAAFALVAWVAVAAPAPGVLAGPLLAALALAGAGELVGRWLFYVTVVPYGMAGSFFGRGR